MLHVELASCLKCELLADVSLVRVCVPLVIYLPKLEQEKHHTYISEVLARNSLLFSRIGIV